ncbi:hypothetical protein ScalyP_jg6696 [Parmales sp. scaly parma]|nr:hypothetical protein ScalyP_jg6696 [Parmales sp. scaly parma]
MPEAYLSRDLTIHNTLHFIFTEYSAFGRSGQNHTQLDNSNWAKLLHQSPSLVGHNLPPSEIDLVFTKAKRGERKLSFPNFLQALQMVAELKYKECDPITAFARLCSGHLFKVLKCEEEGDGNNNNSDNSIPSTFARVVSALQGSDRDYSISVGAGNPSAKAQEEKVNEKGVGAQQYATPMVRKNGPTAIAIHNSHMKYAGEANAKGSIFDKLTNEDTYTGVYKNLKQNGQRGGINGYDGDISGNIRDLSTMTRAELNRSNFMDI